MSRPSNEILDDIESITKEVFKNLENPQYLSEAIIKLAVLNSGLGNYLVEAKDLERSADTSLKFNREMTKMEKMDSGLTATAADSLKIIETKELSDEVNELSHNVDILKIKRDDTKDVLEMVRSRLSLIKMDITNES